MNAIREKILTSALKVSLLYDKSVNRILLSLGKDISKVGSDTFFESIMHILDKISISEFSDLLCYLDDDFTQALGKLSIEQQRAFFIKILPLFTDESFEIATFLNCTVEIIGDYLYNIEFLNSLPKNTSIYEFWSKTFNSIDSLDLERIINNDELFDYYCNMSNLFTKELNYSFSEEQLKKLIDTRHYQFLKFSNLQYSTEYIQSLIMKNPDDVDFVIDLPETVRNKMEIEAALLLNGRVDLINSDDIKKQNLYRIFADSMGLAFQIVIPGERLNIDRHLFDMIFTTKFQPSKIRFEYDTKRELYDSSNEEEKKNLDLSKFANNPHIYDKAEKMAGKSMTKKRFELLLKYINGVFDNRISDENIDDFLSKNPEVFIAFNQFVRQKDLPPHAIVECSISLYHSICNGTVDLFKDFCEFGVFPDMYYLTPELISTVGKDVIRRVAMFPETLYNLLLLQKENRLGLYKILIENSKDLTGDPIRNDCTLVFTCLAFPDLIQKMIDRNELNKENITKLMDLTKNWTVVDINKLNSIDEYYEVNNKFCDKVHETNQDLQTEKHLICRRYFNADYEYISEFYNMFIDSISNIKTDRYIDLFKKIEEIVNCENLDELKNMYRKYNKEFGSERMSLSELETKFKDEIIGVLGSKSFSNSSGPIDITGFDFDMVIHVFGGYGAAIKAKTPYDSWNSKTRIYNSGICTSLINGNYLGHAPTDNHSVIFGFNNIQNSDIRVLAPYDLGSFSQGLKTITWKGQKVYNSNDFCNNSYEYHNEIVINRFLSNGDKRQPSYILCFDKVNLESIKASKQFNIPILFIDVKRHIRIKLDNIEKLKEEYKQSPSITTAISIIDMGESLKRGLMANNKDLVDKYFNSTKVTENILFLVNNSNDLTLLEQIKNKVELEKSRSSNDPRFVPFDGNMDTIISAIDKKKEALTLLKFQTTKSVEDSKVLRSIERKSKLDLEPVTLEGKEGTKKL